MRSRSMQARALEPTHLCISPGPGTPQQAGVSMQMIRAFAGRIPILGVCLGHQSIVECFGGKVVRAGRLMHGKTSPIEHDSRGVFAGVSNPCQVGRYHSLIAAPPAMPRGAADHRAHTRGRDHGGASSCARRRGRAVSPRERVDAARSDDDGQFSAMAEPRCKPLLWMRLLERRDLEETEAEQLLRR